MLCGSIVESVAREEPDSAHGLPLEPLGDLRLERCEALSAGFPGSARQGGSHQFPLLAQEAERLCRS